MLLKKSEQNKNNNTSYTQVGEMWLHTENWKDLFQPQSTNWALQVHVWFPRAYFRNFTV